MNGKNPGLPNVNTNVGGHCTSDALLRLAGELECAFLEGVPIYGVALDFAKAFDNVPVIITLTLLEKLRMHTRVVKPLWFMYNHLQRYFKIRGFVGSLFHATNGIMQGCPLSCLLLNALVSILTRDVLEKVPVTIQSYVDDITLLSRDLDKLKQAIAALEPHSELTQQKLNVSKTYSFAVNSDAASIPFKDDFGQLPNASRFSESASTSTTMASLSSTLRRIWISWNLPWQKFGELTYPFGPVHWSSEDLKFPKLYTDVNYDS